tara:strand:- start:49 stop:930 length:882 start_codon:yes stop_codon:yes gene_type:complete
LARNDSRRLGVKTGATGAPTPPIMDIEGDGENESSPLSFVVPTEFVDLPSKGLYYPENHPLHKVDCIEIRHMTAKDEDILTSRTLLKKGIALDRFLQNIVINKKVDIRKMLVGDKNALVVAARISGYGADYHTRVTCPACLAKVEHSFDLSDSAVKSADDIDFEDLDVEQTERGTFLLILPKMNVNVELRLLNGIDEAEIVRLSEQNKKNKKVESMLTQQLFRTIVSVNGDTGKKTINYVVDNMPASDARHLRKKYQAITPTIDMTQHFECVDCGHEQEMEVPFTTDFFWPDR